MDVEGVGAGDKLLLIRSTTAGGFAGTADALALPLHRLTNVPVNSITRFLWWCSGAQVGILRAIPSEHAKYQAIGAGVLADGLLSGLSAGYALYMVFNSLSFGVLFGSVCGLIIFNLTRFTLASITMPIKEEPRLILNFLGRLFPLLPRLILSVLIGLVVSTPIVVRLFRNEIDERIYRTSRNNRDQRIRDIAKAEASIAMLQSRVNEKEKEVARLRDLLVSEKVGQGGSRVSGEGPVYTALLTQLDKAQKELSDLRNETQADLDKERLYLSDLNAQERILDSEVVVIPGLLAQIQALSELSKENPSVARARWLVTLMFILFYSTPVLSRLFSSRGPYDVLLERWEFGSTEKESLAIQTAFTEALDQSELNPQK